jgi:hypothetical protein
MRPGPGTPFCGRNLALDGEPTGRCPPRRPSGRCGSPSTSAGGAPAVRRPAGGPRARCARRAGLREARLHARVHLPDAPEDGRAPDGPEPLAEQVRADALRARGALRGGVPDALEGPELRGHAPAPRVRRRQMRECSARAARGAAGRRRSAWGARDAGMRECSACPQIGFTRSDHTQSASSAAVHEKCQHSKTHSECAPHSVFRQDGAEVEVGAKRFAEAGI